MPFPVKILTLAAVIESLAPPTPARPPRSPDEPAEVLQKKRQNRKMRERESSPPPLTPGQKARKSLYEEATTARPHAFFMEVSLVFCGVTTSGARNGYTCNPTTHFDMAWRHDQARPLGDVSLWYGLRVAPFSGTGFYEKVPGTYGLTYFGPMLGVGKIDPVPLDGAATAPGEEPEFPTADGWLFTTGIAAVSRIGRSDVPGDKDGTDDFKSQGVTFDGPGIWGEGRYVRIVYGALSTDLFVGAQTGRGKLIVYGGIGLGAWY